MENKVLAQNLEQIKHYNSSFVNEILMAEIEKSSLQLAQNENGEYNLLLNDIPIHSVIGAIDEANNIASTFDDNENSIKLIYGLGLGYLIDSASNKIKNGKIIVYEPNIELIKFVFSIAQIDAFSKNNVFLCSNKNSLCNFISNFADENTSFSISFLNSYKKDLDDIKDVLYQAQRIQGEIIGNKNTFLLNAPDAFAQTIYNTRDIFRNPLIEQLKDVYKGKTAIVLCAGPSLKENIEIIKQNQDKFVIFALNPTLKTLKEAGIVPDFIVAIESKNIISQFDGIETEKSYFICEAFVNYQLTKLKKRKLFNYISKDNFFNYWVLDALKNNSELKSLGTVSYSAFMSAFIMGFDEIIIVGQDLAFKDGSCYAKGCHWDSIECIFDETENKYKIVPYDIEKLIQTYCPNVKTQEEADKKVNKFLENLNLTLCTVRGQNGNLLPSKNDYAIFIKCFEDLAIELKNKKPNLKLINSSLGAQIDGFENVLLEDVVKKLKPIEKLNFDNCNGEFDLKYIVSKMDKLFFQLEKYKNLLEKFVLINEKLLKELEIKNIFTPNALKYLEKHKEILLEIVELSKQKDIDFLINVHLKANEEYLNYENFENLQAAKESIKKMDSSFKSYNRRLGYAIKNLSNSKAIILE